MKQSRLEPVPDPDPRETPSKASEALSGGLFRANGVPYGYCHCGCGARTKLAKRTCTRQGLQKDEPVRFLPGHQHRKSPVAYIVDPETQCWDWQLSLNGVGYGKLLVDGRLQYAHRHYYERANGPIPEGLHIDHLCRNRSCVNPEHLEPVTHAENLRRGTQAKLTEDQVREIRASNEATAVLAERLGVASRTINNVRAGARWGDIG